MDRHGWLEQKVKLLYDITQAVNASLNQQAVLDVLLEQIVAGLGYRAATLRLLDAERQQLELKAAHGLSETYLGKGPVDVTNSEVDWLVLDGQWVTVPDV